MSIEFANVLKDQPPCQNRRKEFITIPPLYSKGFSLELNRAVEILTDYGFKPEPVKLQIRDAKIEYRDCFDFQVVDSRFMHRQKLEAGVPVTIWYITQDVIDESQKIFDEIQRRKIEAKLTKVLKSRLPKNQTQKVTPTSDNYPTSEN